jgi:hypothetical protein
MLADLIAELERGVGRPAEIARRLGGDWSENPRDDRAGRAVR